MNSNIFNILMAISAAHGVLYAAGAGNEPQIEQQKLDMLLRQRVEADIEEGDRSDYEAAYAEFAELYADAGGEIAFDAALNMFSYGTTIAFASMMSGIEAGELDEAASLIEGATRSAAEA